MVQKEFLSKFEKVLFNHLPEPEYIVLSITTAFSNLQLNMKMKRLRFVIDPIFLPH